MLEIKKSGSFFYILPFTTPFPPEVRILKIENRKQSQMEHLGEGKKNRENEFCDISCFSKTSEISYPTSHRIPPYPHPPPSPPQSLTSGGGGEGRGEDVIGNLTNPKLIYFSHGRTQEVVCDVRFPA